MGFWVFSKTAVTAVHPIYLILDRLSIDYKYYERMHADRRKLSESTLDRCWTFRSVGGHAAHACILHALYIHSVKNSPPSAPQASTTLISP